MLDVDDDRRPCGEDDVRVPAAPAPVPLAGRTETVDEPEADRAHC